MRIATYNVEWFNGLFDNKDRLCADGEWSGRYNVTRQEQADALGHVFAEIDADAVMIIEAPDSNGKRNTLKALVNFAEYYDLRTNHAVMGFVNDTQQEIALLFDPSVMKAEHAPHQSQGGIARFDQSFKEPGAAEPIVFSKPPLELLLTTHTQKTLRLIGVHLKSKAPHGARTPKEAAEISLANRRKQLAQAVWLRARIDQYLDEGTPLIVLGDLNDGPGLDLHEGQLGRSSVEIVLGEGARALSDPHASRALAHPLGAAPTTSRFWIDPEKRFLQALLDYIMVSGDLAARGSTWRIWHPMDDPACWENEALRRALLLASDHFPVTLDLDI